MTAERAFTFDHALLAEHPGWSDLLEEIRTQSAHLLIDERDASGLYTRIVVRRADHSVWDADAHQPAVRWPADEAQALERALLQQEERAARLREELERGRVGHLLHTPAPPTWRVLLTEVAERRAQLLDAGGRGRLARVVVRRAADRSVWEANGATPERAVRWTDFEVETLLPPTHVRMVEITRRITNAVKHARSNAPLEVAL